MSRSKDIAEDLVSETVITALKNWDQYTPGTNMGAWLYTIQAGHYRNLVRKNRKTAFFETDEDASFVGIPAPQQSSVELIDAIRIIDTLPSDQRSALYLICRDGHSYEDAARILDCEVGTVKSRVYRARAAIAKAFEGEVAQSATPKA
jgi:RNA polymerase sigma-70 factor (ECF subfamily)